jgi:hypothetical protein
LASRRSSGATAASTGAAVFAVDATGAIAGAGTVLTAVFSRDGGG